MSGWTCQYDHKSYCKRTKTPCIPGMKGCILQTHSQIVFSTPPSKDHNPNQTDKKDTNIDFTTLAKSH